MTAVILASLWVFSRYTQAGFVWTKIVVLVVGTLAWTLRSRPRWLLFLAASSLSAWYGDARGLSLYGFPGEWTGGLIALAFYALLTLLSTEFPWLKFAGIAMAAHCVLQKFGLDPILPLRVLPAGRAVGWTGSPVDAGAIMAMASPVVGLAWLPLIFLGLWACKARAAALATAFVLTKGKLRWAFLPVLFVPFLLKGPSDVARKETWKISAKGWLERPMIGHGPETFLLYLDGHRTPELNAASPGYVQSHTHDDLLEVLFCGGLVGLAAYLFLIWPLLACPPLLALFVVLKFDPVNVEVLAVAALVAANFYRDRDLEESRNPTLHEERDRI